MWSSCSGWGAVKSREGEHSKHQVTAERSKERWLRGLPAPSHGGWTLHRFCQYQSCESWASSRGSGRCPRLKPELLQSELPVTPHWITLKETPWVTLCPMGRRTQMGFTPPHLHSWEQEGWAKACNPLGRGGAHPPGLPRGLQPAPSLPLLILREEGSTGPGQQSCLGDFGLTSHSVLIYPSWQQ